MAVRSRRKARTYSSALRERQKDLTRESVLHALAEIVAEGRVLSFTVQEVADRAGVSHRSLYRHFPTRTALMEELYEWGEAQLGAPAVVNLPDSLDELPTTAGKLFAQFDRQPTWIRAAVIASLATHIKPAGRLRRDRALEKLVTESTSSLRAEAARSALAVLRYLLSSHAWLVLREQFGLSTEQAGEAVAWALRALVADLRGSRSEGVGAGKSLTEAGVKDEQNASVRRRATEHE